MKKRLLALALLLPLLLFFIINGATLSLVGKQPIEAGEEISKCHKASYLLPENELEPVTDELSRTQKNRIKDPHKFNGK